MVASSTAEAPRVPTRYPFLYPIDWPQISAAVRFERAGGRCEGCGRPHGATVAHLGDGRWYDAEARAWRSGRGRFVAVAIPADTPVFRTRVVLAACHKAHDPSRNRPSDLAALCQRCHLLHDAPEHARRRRFTYLRRRALGDLFLGPYPTL